MSILTTDLKCYQPASVPEDDVSTSGGAINTSGIIDQMVLAATDALKVKSTSGSDSSGTTMTITGRDATGAIVSENHPLNGTSAVTFTTSFERILKAVLTGTTTVGVVSIYRSDGTTLVVAIPVAKTSVRRLFYDSSSSASPTVRYEKVFWKNEHATLTLNAAEVTLTADPSATITMALAASLNDSVSVADRLTAPAGGLSFVDDGVAQSVPGGVIAAASAVGVWLKLSLGAGNAAIKSTETTQLAGTSV